MQGWEDGDAAHVQPVREGVSPEDDDDFPGVLARAPRGSNLVPRAPSRVTGH